MAYDNPFRVTYNLGTIDFGAGDEALAIRAPAGFSNGRLRHIGVVVKETFTNTTTEAFVRIGTATDADAYAELAMGTAADTNYYCERDDTDAIIDEWVDDTQLEVACIAPTGGTPAGIGDVHIVIDWF
jgi:hypothetical protein